MFYFEVFDYIVLLSRWSFKYIITLAIYYSHRSIRKVWILFFQNEGYLGARNFLSVIVFCSIKGAWGLQTWKSECVRPERYGGYRPDHLPSSFRCLVSNLAWWRRELSGRNNIPIRFDHLVFKPFTTLHSRFL